MGNFVCVDLGASNTRYVGKDEVIRFLPNNIEEVGMDKTINLAPYDDSLESALDVTIVKKNASENNSIFPIRQLFGEMASRYSGNNTRPSGLTQKNKQVINYRQAIMAAAAYLHYTNSTEDELTLYLALPPAEVDTGDDMLQKFNEYLAGTFSVRLNKLNKEITVTINKVALCPESFLAMLSYYYDTTCKPTSTGEKYAIGNVLSVDVGESTTDLAIVKNKKYMERSGQTYRIGCNVAKGVLSDLIDSKFGSQVSAESLETAMIEGRILLGSDYVDVSELVCEAKAKYAKDILSNIQTYFRKVSIPIQDIRAIVVSGGGSTESGYTDESGNYVLTAPPMSEYITKELNMICDGVEVVQHNVDPRLANITGLLIRAKIDALVASKSKKS